MRGLTVEERMALEMRGAVDYQTGVGLLQRGLLVRVEPPEGGIPDANYFMTTPEGERALRLDMLARVFK